MTEENTNQNQEEIRSSANEAKKKTNWGKRVIYGVIILILLIAAIQVSVADKYKAQVLVIAGEKKVGVNPTTERLDFGDLSGDTSATRLITMKAGGMDTFVHVAKFGGVGELIKVSENNFTMKSGDTKKLELAMYMPPSAPVGQKYSGYVWIFKIPKFW